jgi:pyruvate/2-oxoglutarate dehydrogenase complex dihydrolipoamide acyltransferase (E2) component
MRIAVGLLAALSAGALTSALADPPTDAAPAAATAPATPTNAPAAAATTSAPATKPAAPEFDQVERHFVAEGYRPEMRNGLKVFCRRETALGSHLPGPKVCATAAQLNAAEAEAKEATEQVQKFSPVAAGLGGGH